MVKKVRKGGNEWKGASVSDHVGDGTWTITPLLMLRPVPASVDANRVVLSLFCVAMRQESVIVKKIKIFELCPWHPVNAVPVNH